VYKDALKEFAKQYTQANGQISPSHMSMLKGIGQAAALIEISRNEFISSVFNNRSCYLHSPSLMLNWL
jgi:hypothetical protein